jgi:hypothetical protein
MHQRSPVEGTSGFQLAVPNGSTGVVLHLPGSNLPGNPTPHSVWSRRPPLLVPSSFHFAVFAFSLTRNEQTNREASSRVTLPNRSVTLHFHSLGPTQ